MSFGASLKDAVSVIFNWNRELLEGSTKHSREWREEIDHWWAERLGIPHLTPRWVLQQWGTEVARKAFHDEIWVASVENKLLNIKEDIVITDCRFPNEIAAVKNAGGITMRTHRGPEPEWIPEAQAYTRKLGEGADKKDYIGHQLVLELDFGVHASEYSSVGLEYDYHLDNNGTIDSLHKQLESIING